MCIRMCIHIHIQCCIRCLFYIFLEVNQCYGEWTNVTTKYYRDVKVFYSEQQLCCRQVNRFCLEINQRCRELMNT